jgi:LPXTG-site transpeptidase (sortase) family protein
MVQNSHPSKIARTIIVFILTASFVSGVGKPSVSIVEAAPASDDTTQNIPQLVVDLDNGENSGLPDETTTYPDDFSHKLFPVGNVLFFAGTDGSSGFELWKSIPPYNKNSTTRVADIAPGSNNSNPHGFIVNDNDNTVFFSATDGVSGYELYRTSPPYTSVQRVADINPTGSSNPQYMVAIGNSVFFQANDGSTGTELWMTQSPYTSAVEVLDLWPGGGSSNPQNLIGRGWTLFFVADDTTGKDIWKLEPPYNSTSLNRVEKIFAKNPYGDSDPSNLYTIGSTLFFQGLDGQLIPQMTALSFAEEAYCRNNDDQCSSGFELWKSPLPNIPETASRVTDLTGEPWSSFPFELHNIGDTLFFTAFHPATGYEMWKSDPPYDPVNTVIVWDANTGTDSSMPLNKENIGTTLFFSAVSADNGRELWKAIPPYNNSGDYIASRNNVRMIKDIWNTPNMSSDPTNLIPMNTTLFFTAHDGTHGRELWKSEPPYDGSTTQLAADIRQGEAGSDPHNTTSIGSILFFAATTRYHGTELWKYDTKIPILMPGTPLASPNGYANYSLPSTGFAPGKITAIGAQPVEKQYSQAGDMTLEIPSLGVKAPLVGIPKSDSGWDLSWLWNQVGYLGGTAFPTWAGNSVITGHAYLPNGKPGPFVNLGNLGYGSQIEIHAWGQRYIYEVRSVERVQPDDQKVLKHEELPWVTLLTCQGYDEAKGTYRWRLAVKAVQVKVASE